MLLLSYLTLPHGAIGLSVVCDRGISWSHSSMHSNNVICSTEFSTINHNLGIYIDKVELPTLKYLNKSLYYSKLFICFYTC